MAKISEIEEGHSLKLKIRTPDKGIDMNATMKKIVKDEIAIITIDFNTNKKLVFDNVQVDIEYSADNSMPIVWHDVKVVHYHEKDYAIQSTSDGQKMNRRNSFRVGVAMMVDSVIPGKSGINQVMLKDVSLSGFAITDNRKELGLDIGDEVTVKYEDIGHILKLVGRLVRVVEEEDYTVYGFEICNLCKDLSSYLSIKQRRSHGKK